MAKGLQTAMDMIGVSSPQNWRAKQAEACSMATTIVTLVDARIEHGRWLFDCACGSGVAVHPDWSEARCMGAGCGRVYTNVRIPSERAAIEATLLARPDEKNRNWDPRTRETVRDLEAENAANLPSETKR